MRSSFLQTPTTAWKLYLKETFDENQTARHPLLSAIGPGAKLKVWKLLIQNFARMFQRISR